MVWPPACSTRCSRKTARRSITVPSRCSLCLTACSAASSTASSHGNSAKVWWWTSPIPMTRRWAPQPLLSPIISSLYIIMLQTTTQLLPSCCWWATWRRSPPSPPMSLASRMSPTSTILLGPMAIISPIASMAVSLPRTPTSWPTFWKR